MPSWVAVLAVYVHCLLTAVTSVNPGCDCVVYQSYGLNDGHFTSPNFPEFYPPKTNCILYSFYGDSLEIIELTFLEFDLRMPEPDGTCRDFVRVFQNLERPEVNEYSKWDVELCGNYTTLKRRKFYSSNRTLILEFHTDSPTGHNNRFKGFRGKYQFLDKRNYITTGQRVEGQPCTYEFHSNASHKNGSFFSPFYPQLYRPNTRCRYNFHAQPGERVRLVFSNIQLHNIGGSCYHAPDVLTVYDGDDHGSAIGQYCGFHNTEEVISFSPHVLVTFTTDGEHQQQGFAANYYFIGKTPSGTIPRSMDSKDSTRTSGDRGQNKSPSITVRPSQCGDTIDSMAHKNGTIESPNYPRPYPPQITCRFKFKGLGKERVQLRFVHMDLHFPSGDPSAPVDCTGSDSVTVYITVNGEAEVLGRYCGEKLPPMLMSNSHTMTVEFQSHMSHSTVTGFRANYEFVTNFGITTGQQDSRGICVFNYVSSVASEGKIMSPNWPGLYPRNTECHYLFYGRDKEQVHISFLSFEVDGIQPRCEERTNSDYVSFSNFQDTEDRKLYRMCNQNSGYLGKKEITSDGPFFRVTFKSNDRYDAHGFQAYYQFRGGVEPTQGPMVFNGASSRTSLSFLSVLSLVFVIAASLASKSGLSFCHS